MFRRSGVQCLNYSHLSRHVTQYTGWRRTIPCNQHEYMVHNTNNWRKWSSALKRTRPWWKEMPKYTKPYSGKFWFEPLPASNYLHWKADGLYTVPADQVITLQHVVHLKMLPVKMTGRTFTMPLVRWLVGARVRNTVGNGLIRDEPVYKLTKPKYWHKA